MCAAAEAEGWRDDVRSWSERRRGFKHQLIRALRRKDFTYREASSVVKAMFGSMVEALRRGEPVETPIGKFTVIDRGSSHKYRFGKVIEVAGRKVKFTPARARSRRREISPSERLEYQRKRSDFFSGGGQRKYGPGSFNALVRFHTSWPHEDAWARGRRILQLRNSGVSLRDMALMIGCSESLIRHLGMLAEQGRQAQILFQTGQLSARQIVRAARKERRTGRFLGGRQP